MKIGQINLWELNIITVFVDAMSPFPFAFHFKTINSPTWGEKQDKFRYLARNMRSLNLFGIHFNHCFNLLGVIKSDAEVSSHKTTTGLYLPHLWWIKEQDMHRHIEWTLFSDKVTVTHLCLVCVSSVACFLFMPCNIETGSAIFSFLLCVTRKWVRATSSWPKWPKKGPTTTTKTTSVQACRQTNKQETPRGHRCAPCFENQCSKLKSIALT